MWGKRLLGFLVVLEEMAGWVGNVKTGLVWGAVAVGGQERGMVCSLIFSGTSKNMWGSQKPEWLAALDAQPGLTNTSAWQSAWK